MIIIITFIQLMWHYFGADRQKLGLARDKVKELTTGALLHDIGMVVLIRT